MSEWEFVRGFTLGAIVVTMVFLVWLRFREQAWRRNHISDPERSTRRLDEWDVGLLNLTEECNWLYEQIVLALHYLQLGKDADIVKAMIVLREALKRRKE
jgi:hypothetical protein